MTQRVHVVLVPKSPAGDRGPLEKLAFPRGRSQHFAACPEKAEAARKGANCMDMDAATSPKSTVDCLVDKEKFETLFKTRLVVRPAPSSQEAVADGAETEYLAPEGEVQVPEELADAVEFAFVPTPPEFYGSSFIPPTTALYHLRLTDVARALNVERCHRRGWTGRGVTVSAGDTGFAKHAFFDENGFNISRVASADVSDPEIDPNGHGTGESANALWIAPDCRFFGIKSANMKLGLEATLKTKPRVMVQAWGMPFGELSKAQLQAKDPNALRQVVHLEQLLAEAMDDGVVTIFAAGNKGGAAFPACIPDVIAVGGVTVNPDGSLQASNYASSFESLLYPGRAVPDFCGVAGGAGTLGAMPGHIMLPVPNDSGYEGANLPEDSKKLGWGIFSGTSAAAYQIAGIAALMIQANPVLDHDRIKQILAATATNVTAGQSASGHAAGLGHDLATGSGFVNAFAACLMAEQIGAA